MATFTDNYNLKKPEESDFFDIEDMNGNSDIIDTVLMDFEERLSDNASKEAIESIDKSVAIHRLGIMGEKSGIYRNIDMLKNLSEIEHTYYDFYGLMHILDGIIELEEHVGSFLKKVSSSGDTSFDTLSTIDNVVSNAQAMNIIISNDKTKKLFYSSRIAMEKASEISSAVTKILSDSYFFERLKEDERLMDIVYNSNVMANSMCSNNDFLNYIFDDFEIFRNVITYYDFFEKLVSSATFIQRLITNTDYYKYILNNNVLTKYLCQNQTACNSFLGNTTIVNAVKENISLIINALKYENTTTVFKNNTEVLEFISKSPACLMSLCELGGDINIDFYKNIQNYYKNIQEYLLNSRMQSYTSYAYSRNVTIKGRGIYYIFKVYSTEAQCKIDVYADANKTKLLKSIPKGTAVSTNFNIVCFGEFAVYLNGGETTYECNKYVVI